MNPTESALNTSSSINQTKSSSKAATWAPLNVPISRRRQTFTVLMWYLIIPLSYLVSFLILFLSRASGPIFYFFIAYLCWMLMVSQYHVNGGLKSDAFRRAQWWKWFRDYFPIYLHKSAEIPPDRSYIFGYHPHGIIGMGAFCNFATEATDFSGQFPGIDLRLLTLTTNFRVPFYHLYLSLLGICDASRSSINNVLYRGNGNSVMLVLGGAKEALDAHPNSYLLTLYQRKGFVKIALENGASLVPVIGFGETDIYDQVANPVGSRLRRLQSFLQSRLGFSLPLIKGRGVFNYAFGLLPFRRPIHAVVGKPLILPVANDDGSKLTVTQALIDEHHSRYLRALQDLFNEYKAQFAPNAEMKFVDQPSESTTATSSD